MPKNSQKSIFDAIRLENLLTKNLPYVLKGETDINPDNHDGSYELVHEAVCMLAKEDINGLDIKDLELLYFMTSRRRLESQDRGNRIERSHLSEEHKKDMHDILDKILQKTKKGEYKIMMNILVCFNLQLDQFKLPMRMREVFSRCV